MDSHKGCVMDWSKFPKVNYRGLFQGIEDAEENLKMLKTIFQTCAQHVASHPVVYIIWYRMTEVGKPIEDSRPSLWSVHTTLDAAKEALPAPEYGIKYHVHYTITEEKTWDHLDNLSVDQLLSLHE